MRQKSFMLSAVVAALVSLGVLGPRYFGEPGDGRQTILNRKEVPTTSSQKGVSTSPTLEDDEPHSTSLSLAAFADQDFSGTGFTVGPVLAEASNYTRHYITYVSDGLTISGIMNVPRGDGPFPLLVLNHGYIDPAIYTNGRGLKREQDYLAGQGYVVVHADYRGHAESDSAPNTDEQFRFGYAADVINVIQAIKTADLPYVDAERVGMLGHSMGGGVAWRIAVIRPDLVDAFVQFAPVSADERDNFEKWIRQRTDTATVILQRHGEPASNSEFWDGISPFNYFDLISAPILIHHGTADESVPLEWSKRATELLEEQGKEVTLKVYPGEPHEFIDAWPQVMRRSLVFFDTHVKN